MYLKTENYTNDMEILYSNANLVAFSGFLLASNVTANSEGKKLVNVGALVDADGKAVTEVATGTEPDITYSLSSTPIGVLRKTTDVTNGDSECALIVEGYLRVDRVLENFVNTKAAIQTALPKITFR